MANREDFKKVHIKERLKKSGAIDSYERAKGRDLHEKLWNFYLGSIESGGIFYLGDATKLCEKYGFSKNRLNRAYDKGKVEAFSQIEDMVSDGLLGFEDKLYKLGELCEMPIDYLDRVVELGRENCVKSMYDEYEKNPSASLRNELKTKARKFGLESLIEGKL